MFSAKDLKGVFTAIVTPFTQDGSAIDYESAAKLISFQLDAGVSGIVICGSTGEAATLTESEYREFVGFIYKEVKNRVPCIAGIGTNSSAKAQEMAIWLEQTGLDAALVVSPPYNKPSQEGLYAHFAAIKKASSIPLVAYNIPGRAVVNMQPQTVARLAADKLIVGLKDATASLDQHMDLLALVGDSISITSGEDSLVYALMACGAKGVICASANAAPKVFVDLCKSMLAGDYKAGLQYQLKALPVVRAMFLETNPIPVKAAVALQEVIRYPTVRLPLLQAKPETVEKIRQVLKR